jgi:hypothetical protein
MLCQLTLQSLDLDLRVPRPVWHRAVGPQRRQPVQPPLRERCRHRPENGSAGSSPSRPFSNCARCGREFERTRSDRIYCSAWCRQAASDARVAARKLNGNGHPNGQADDPGGRDRVSRRSPGSSSWSARSSRLGRTTNACVRPSAGAPPRWSRRATRSRQNKPAGGAGTGEDESALVHFLRKAERAAYELRGRISAPMLMRLSIPAQSTATGSPPPNGRRS